MRINPNLFYLTALSFSILYMDRIASIIEETHKLILDNIAKATIVTTFILVGGTLLIIVLILLNLSTKPKI